MTLGQITQGNLLLILTTANNNALAARITRSLSTRVGGFVEALNSALNRIEPLKSVCSWAQSRAYVASLQATLCFRDTLVLTRPT